MKSLVYLTFVFGSFACKSFSSGLTNLSPAATDTLQPQKWNQLSPEQYKVCHDKATEAPFSGKYDNFYEKGIYYCAVCKSPLFSSESKFKSGTGWPSFNNEINDNVASIKDSSYHMMREEIICRKCSSHLGHVFDNGPAPTGMRYCVNSLSLVFKAAEKK